MLKVIQEPMPITGRPSPLAGMAFVRTGPASAAAAARRQAGGDAQRGQGRQERAAAGSCFVAAHARPLAVIAAQRPGALLIQLLAEGPHDRSRRGAGMGSMKEAMRFDSKIAVALRDDLETWQKLNVACFLAGGLAGASPEIVGAPSTAGLTISIFTRDLFATGNDADNRAAVAAVAGDSLDLAGLAIHAECRSVDKVMKGLSLHR